MTAAISTVKANVLMLLHSMTHFSISVQRTQEVLCLRSLLAIRGASNSRGIVKRSLNDYIPVLLQIN